VSQFTDYINQSHTIKFQRDIKDGGEREIEKDEGEAISDSLFILVIVVKPHI
jgi:hypothetical protein